MIMEAVARIWMKCEKCGTFRMWESDDTAAIGIFEMLSPDLVIAAQAAEGWTITEEGTAEHIQCPTDLLSPKQA